MCIRDSDISRGARHQRKARDKGKRKIKRLFAVHCSCCSAHLRQQILTTRGGAKRTNQNTIHCSAKIVTFLAQKMRGYDFFHGFANSFSTFTGLNYLILYIDFAKTLFWKIRVQFQFFLNPKLSMQGRSAVKSALGVRYFCARRFKSVQYIDRVRNALGAF